MAGLLLLPARQRFDSFPIRENYFLERAVGKLKTMSEAVRKVIDNYPVGHRFHGNQLHEDVSYLYPPARTMYVDTIQRMMRRHCSHQYKTVNQNKSLYEKIQFKSIIDQIRKVAPKEVKPVIPPGSMKQGELPFFNQGFLAGFLILFLGVGLASGFASGCLRGRPLPGVLRITSSADLSYKASLVIGTIPALKSRCFAAFNSIPKITAISEAVYPSMLILSDYSTIILKNVVKKPQYTIHKCSKNLKYFSKKLFF